MTTWTFGAEGSSLWFTVSIDDSGRATVEMLAGSMDLNALWFSDGDANKDGSTTLTKSESALNMNGSGSLDAEGNQITWDEVSILSMAGLGKAGTTKSTYLTAGETQEFVLDAGTLTFLSSVEDFSALTLGVRATSVNGGSSVKLNALADEDQVVTQYLTVGRAGVWFEKGTANGVLDNGEALITDAALLDGDDDGFYTIDGLDVATADVTVRFVDGKTTTPLDLTGFGAGDKIVLDGKTNASDVYGFFPSATVKTTFKLAGAKSVGFSGNRFVAAGQTFNPPAYPLTFTSFFQAGFIKNVGTKILGQFSEYLFRYTSEGQVGNDKARGSYTLAKGLVSGASAAYSIDVIAPL